MLKILKFVLPSLFLSLLFETTSFSYNGWRGKTIDCQNNAVVLDEQRTSRGGIWRQLVIRHSDIVNYFVSLTGKAPNIKNEFIFSCGALMCNKFDYNARTYNTTVNMDYIYQYLFYGDKYLYRVTFFIKKQRLKIELYRDGFDTDILGSYTVSKCIKLAESW